LLIVVIICVISSVVKNGWIGIETILSQVLSVFELENTISSVSKIDVL
jgi:hypothetical protein